MAGERRRLSAILAADVVGYSRLVGLDEAGTVARVRALFREVAQPEVTQAGGRVFKLVGDGFLAEFPSAVAAVTCAAAIQAATEARAAAEPEDRRLRARIGVHLGDVLVEGADLFGDGVNVAARLEGLAEPGGVVLSAPVVDAVRGRVPQALEDLGEQALKNIARPIRVFRLAQPALEPPRLAVPERPSLVVLPFQNLSGDPEQDYFADGRVEDITTALSRIRWLFVIARNSAFTYKGRAVDVRQVGRDLGVRYVLEGSVRKAGNRVRITGQLIEAETGRHVWADRFDGDLADIFELQDRVTEALCGAIEPNLQRAEIERAQRKPTGNLDAYDLYLRALPHLEAMSRSDNEQALSLLRAAVALDPSFVLGKAAIGRALRQRDTAGWSVPSDAEDGLRLASDVLASTRDDALSLAWAAATYTWFSGDHDLAVVAAEQAVAMNPNSAMVLSEAARVYSWACQSDRSLELLDRALRLSPRDQDTARMLMTKGMALVMAARFSEAEKVGRHALSLAPNFDGAHRLLAYSLFKQGRSEEACAIGQRLRARNPEGAGIWRQWTERVFADKAFVRDVMASLTAIGLLD